jgi:Superfamily I DNA and RNA helicases and helicase subunits
MSSTNKIAIAIGAAAAVAGGAWLIGKALSDKENENEIQSDSEAETNSVEDAKNDFENGSVDHDQEQNPTSPFSVEIGNENHRENPLDQIMSFSEDYQESYSNYRGSVDQVSEDGFDLYQYYRDHYGNDSDGDYNDDNGDYNEDDDDYDDDDEEIDNSDRSFKGNIHLTLNYNNRFSRLNECNKTLCGKYSTINNLAGDNKLQALVEEFFPEGMRTEMFVRNYTLSDSGNNLILGIRPKIYYDEDNHLLPQGVSLLFKGQVWGKSFLINSVIEVADTEQLEYESLLTASTYRTPEKIGRNVLWDVAQKTHSLAEHTGNKLKHWDGYLNWREALVKKQIFGCKYYKITCDSHTRKLVFRLVFEGEEEYKKIKKRYFRDFLVFGNDYSSDQWHFKYLDSPYRKRCVCLGKLARGKFKEYYLLQAHSDNNQSEISEKTTDSADFLNALSEEERELCRQFDNPYVVEVGYEPDEDKFEGVDVNDLSDDEWEQYVNENIIPDYPSDGFLALSALGDFSLNKRFRDAFNRLRNDDCISPNLALWLFDVSKARLPQGNVIPYDEWLKGREWNNEKLAKNENQTRAIYKMVMAPDLCLIQGPPGTGKTTVIAEAIYQLVSEGKRVLLASQSNDAIDNALERLAQSPRIRAIQLVSEYRRRRVKDFSASDFSEENALAKFYNSLQKTISDKWLTEWENIDNHISTCEDDIRDAESFRQDIAEFTEKLISQDNRRRETRNACYSAKDAFETAQRQNENLYNAKHQLNKMIDFYYEKSTDDFYLYDEMLSSVFAVFNAVQSTCFTNGIRLLPEKDSFKPDNAHSNSGNKYIMIAMKNLAVLKKLRDKLCQNKNQPQTDGEVLALRREIDELREKMSECFENGDDEGAAGYRSALMKKQAELNARQSGSASIILTNSEKTILTADLAQTILNEKMTDDLLRIFEESISLWENAIDEVMGDLQSSYGSSKPVDLESLNEQIKQAEAKDRECESEINRLTEKIRGKRNILGSLRKKYRIESTDENEIIQGIQSVLAEYRKRADEHRELRNTWESTMREFSRKLQNDDTLNNDKQYYDDIYIKSCNVVAISCTANMSVLNDEKYGSFDVAIIDEVSKATPPELLIPLMRAKKAILVGDHRQLPPMFKDQENSYKEMIDHIEDESEEIKELLTMDNFNKYRDMVTASLFKEYFEKADESIKATLLRQYRMHSDISAVINRFYEHKLENGLSAEAEAQLKAHGMTISGVNKAPMIQPGHHAYWIDSSRFSNGKPAYETHISGSTSCVNYYEVAIIMELLKKMVSECRAQGYSKENKKTVGVISFYQGQVNLLRDAFKSIRREPDFSSLQVDINTVDRFQGKEKNVIITSLVRNKFSHRASEHIKAFERINVAFSRAQQLLVIVGAADMYRPQEIELPNMDRPGTRTLPVYKNILDDLNRNACFKSGSDLMTKEIEEDVLQKIRDSKGDTL